MNTFMRSALAAGVVVTATLTLNLVILDANHSDMMAIAELPEIRGELHYDASSDIFDLPNDLVTAYMRCSEAATQRMLARAEASNCASTYLRLKLSFLPDVTLQSFKEMTADQRSEANNRGYLQFLRWKELEQTRYTSSADRL